MDDFKPFIAKVATGATLSREEARDAFDTILSGEVTNAQSAASVMASSTPAISLRRCTA